MIRIAIVVALYGCTSSSGTTVAEHQQPIERCVPSSSTITQSPDPDAPIGIRMARAEQSKQRTQELLNQVANPRIDCDE